MFIFSSYSYTQLTIAALQTIHMDARVTERCYIIVQFVLLADSFPWIFVVVFFTPNVHWLRFQDVCLLITALSCWFYNADSFQFNLSLNLKFKVFFRTKLQTESWDVSIDVECTTLILTTLYYSNYLMNHHSANSDHN